MKDRSVRAWVQLEGTIREVLDSHLDHALEIGCWEGVTTNKLARIFRAVETIDVLRKPAGLLSNVKFHNGQSHEVLKHMGAQVPEPMLDFVLIDGQHNYSAAYGDFALSRPMVRTPGLICFDDVDWNDGVRRAALDSGATIEGSLAFLVL